MIKIRTDINSLRKKSCDATINEAKKILTKLKIKMREIGDRGIGLCAPQIGIYKNVIYLDYNNQKLSLINPEIIKSSDSVSTFGEGCLSLPNTIKNNINITRPKRIKLKYMDESGNTKIDKFDNIIGRAIQHEIDHLNGILIIDKTGLIG